MFTNQERGAAKCTGPRPAVSCRRRSHIKRGVATCTGPRPACICKSTSRVYFTNAPDTRKKEASCKKHRLLVRMPSHVSHSRSNGACYTRSSLAYLLVETAAPHRACDHRRHVGDPQHWLRSDACNKQHYRRFQESSAKRAHIWIVHREHGRSQQQERSQQGRLLT